MAVQIPLSIPPPQPWSLPSPPSLFSLGDSYSAGIGASCGWVTDAFDPYLECLRCLGSYVYQIADLTYSPPFDNSTNVYHIACTASNTHDITHRSLDKNRTSQIDLMKNITEPVGWGTLTIGGNDVGFGSIIANCIAFNKPSCDEDLNFTEIAITDRKVVRRLAKTYMAVLDAARAENFTLIVPGYAQFFNALTTECDVQYLFFGRYLTRELRSRVNQMVIGFNLVIQIAVASVQLHLVFTNSKKSIYYEDWDGIFEGHRFCEEVPKTWKDSWFFTIDGPDTLPNGTVVVASDLDRRYRDGGDEACEEELEMSYEQQMACNIAMYEKERGKDVKVEMYPWWAMKIMHPKTIAHHELAMRIYKKWIDGEYFFDRNDPVVKKAAEYEMAEQLQVI
jgi:hypothetical protein